MAELFFQSCSDTSKQLHYKDKFQEGFLKCHEIVTQDQVITKKTRLLQTMKQVSKDLPFHFLVLLALLAECKLYQKAKWKPVVR